MNLETATAINYEKLKEAQLEQQGYSKQDIDLLGMINKEDGLERETANYYLKIYIHNKVLWETQYHKIGKKLDILLDGLNKLK